MSGPLKLQIEDLGNQIGRLPASKRDFARSLCDQVWQRGLSEKQIFWVGKLLELAEAPQIPQAPAEA